ncbi:MAG: Aldehyde dehydrogenase [uncultured Thermomicrobiales bacterium]|uniref:Aldehyde dehydrogenase n=1 Tax=uncultured Thermomicrobiales bacterium TaxID=1645740 RepID=A0A6J4U354_9BACT|nr:MAG: Aldehyde dehydrogenase [uncultured Thermomicrobiales bacterium]
MTATLGTETTAGAPTFGNYIGGAWRPAASGETFEDRSPADTDDLVGRFAASGQEDVEAAVAAAAEAAAGWRRTSAIARGNILLKAADLLAARAEQVARELTREEGKTLKEGLGETNRAVQILRYFAGETQQPDGEHYPSVSPTTLLYTAREPLGVVGVITPWNFPIAIPTWKVAPALAFGNTVVLKPASLTPLCAVRLVECLADAGLPPGVLNLVTGSASRVGDALVRDPRLVGITFTGSNAVGQQLRRTAAETGTKLQLELGGKNPAIVLADADLEHALTHVINGAMMSTGQKCTATSRAIVDRSIAPRFTDLLERRVRDLRVGDPLAAETQIGPLISADAADSVASEVQAAQESGGGLLVGGGRLAANGHGRGHFLAPALFGDVDPASRLGQEELFGPVLGVIPVDGLDEAVEVANQVRYGLSASIFTRDLGRALGFVREIQAGIVHVNSETAGAEPHVPFGGMKGSSSYSREQGKSAREFFTQVKTVYLDPPPA